MYSMCAYMDDTEHIDLLPLDTLQAYLVAINTQYLNYYIDNTVLTITFSRRLRGEIRCEAVSYWGEIYRATGSNHLLAGCRAIYKALKNIDGRIELDYYQRYL